MIGLERHQGSAEIRDVLAHRQVAFDTDAWKWLVGVVLAPEHDDARIELICIIVGPPGGKDAAAVVLASFIVEPVNHFVADDRAYAAKALSLVCGLIQSSRSMRAFRAKRSCSTRLSICALACGEK